jgi:CheY-like chemotaxis protein
MADEHRLLQVFANLISNAVKYSPAEGVVEVAVRRRDRQFRVTVRDFGRGIPAAFRERMFQRFAQADASDTREKGGTGLGLSIAKAIVEGHGGGIDFEAAEGAGTEFFFDLPEWQESIVPAPDNRPLVLICEDNADVAMVLADLLDGAGVTSDRAATAAAALEMTGAKRYRALLLDIGLPDMDGLELVRRLRAVEASRDLPVIVVSGHSRGVAGSWQGQALSILDWIQKPVDPDRLGKALQAALELRARPRILHVEDDLDIIQVTQALLEGDTEYHYATTLAQARQALLQGGFDLLLLDLTLPDGSGLDLLDAVGADAKVILFSGQESGPDATRNVAAALTKASTSSDKLLAAIQRVLDLPGE